MRGRFLIVNADDFGISKEVNEAVILAHRKGILTSTSLIVSGGQFEEAVRLANENPSLAVGIHVTCAHGKSVLPHSEIPHIVDRDGNFEPDPAIAGLKYFFCKKARKELFAEVAAQFDRFSAAGLDFSHVDSHCHMHVNPVVLDAVMRNAEKHGIRRLRVPEDDLFAARQFTESFPATAGYALVFKLLAGRMKRRLRRSGFKFPAKVFGNLLTGRMTREYFLSILDRVPEGMSEIYLHPGLLSDSMQPNPVSVQLLREAHILLDSEVRLKIDRLKIIPATYSDMDGIK
ncbi:MAG: hopanoid biosynthesis-associated protein HpnK [Syntrophobacteraceae bacterium]